MRRQWDVATGKSLCHFSQPRIEHASPIDYLALLRGPGSNLCADWSRMKVFLGFFARNFFDNSIDPDLPFYFHPVKDEGCMRVLFQFPPFFTGVIREENKAGIIESL